MNTGKGDGIKIAALFGTPPPRLCGLVFRPICQLHVAVDVYLCTFWVSAYVRYMPRVILVLAPGAFKLGPQPGFTCALT